MAQMKRDCMENIIIVTVVSHQACSTIVIFFVERFVMYHPNVHVNDSLENGKLCKMKSDPGLFVV